MSSSKFLSKINDPKIVTERLKKDIIKLVIDEVVIDGEKLKIAATIPLPNKIQEREIAKTVLPDTFSARGGSAFGGNAGATLGPINQTKMERIWTKHKQINTNLKPTVLVGMSGGVDSSVAAALLQRRGFKIVGGFIKNWSDAKHVWTGECNWRGERRDALRVAAKLGIPLLTFDFEKEYRALVMKDFFKSYKIGETPNPDILCNQYIKFGLFFKLAKRLKMDYIATGHYARVRRDSSGVAHLLRGADVAKDQSYFLYRISQEALSRTFFPIGNLKKSEVRNMAKQFALPVADKPDSQGICFVGKLDLKDFLRTRIKSKPGEITDQDGRVIGRHDGLDRYTIGQRHGFAAGGGASAWYVARKDIRKNRLIVVPGANHPWLYSDSAAVRDVHWLGVCPPALPLKVKVQVRYRQKPVSAEVTSDIHRCLAPRCLAPVDKYKSLANLKFDKPVKAVAAGQSAVFYKGQECLGGGFLC